MKHVLFLLIIFPFAAMATGGHHGHGGQGGSGGLSNSTSLINLSNSASNRAVLEGQQDQSQLIYGGDTTVNNNAVRQHRNNPGIFLGMPNPTANCMAVVGGGAVFSGIGFTAAGSLANENCEIQEAARNMHYMGDTKTAMEIACSGKHAKHTTKCMALQLDNGRIKKAMGDQLAMMQKQLNQTQKIIDKTIEDGKYVPEKITRPSRDATNWGANFKE